MVLLNEMSYEEKSRLELYPGVYPYTLYALYRFVCDRHRKESPQKFAEVFRIVGIGFEFLEPIILQIVTDKDTLEREFPIINITVQGKATVSGWLNRSQPKYQFDLPYRTILTMSGANPEDHAMWYSLFIKRSFIHWIEDTDWKSYAPPHHNLFSFPLDHVSRTKILRYLSSQEKRSPLLASDLDLFQRVY